MLDNEEIHINPLGFREYDARWIYPKDINKEGIKNVGKGLGSLIILRKNIQKPRVRETTLRALRIEKGS